MRNNLLLPGVIVIVFSFIVFNIPGCQKSNEKTSITEESTTDSLDVSSKTPTESIKPLGQIETELKENLNEYLAKLEKRRQELMQKESELDEREALLNQEKTIFSKKESALKRLQTISYITIVIGIVVFLIGLFFIILSGRKRSSAKPGEKNKDKKTILRRQKESGKSKTEPTEKKDEKPSEKGKIEKTENKKETDF